MQEPKVKHNANCFVCGKDNPQGLKVKLSEDKQRVCAEFTGLKFHEGPGGFLHGGIIAALLDEVTTGLINSKVKGVVFTAHLEVRFRRPAPINSKLIAEASILKEDRRIHYVQASLKDKEGNLFAEAVAKFLTKR